MTSSSGDSSECDPPLLPSAEVEGGIIAGGNFLSFFLFSSAPFHSKVFYSMFSRLAVDTANRNIGASAYRR